VNRVFLLHFAVTWYMTGVIWVIQILHYPMLTSDRQSFHMTRVTYVVAGPMLVEAITGVWLWWQFRSDLLWLAASIALLLIWTSTFVLQVPAHRRLTEAWNAADHSGLITGNWIRTILWSLRAALLCFLA
jgi:hypothetical protein